MLGHCICSISADLDNFKQVNDRLGHAHGDTVLIKVAGALRGAVRPHDFVARNGGDEFCVVSDGISVEEAEAMAERIRSTVLAVTTPEGVGISVGVAHTDASSPERDLSLLAIADRHMYSEKQRHSPALHRVGYTTERARKVRSVGRRHS